MKIYQTIVIISSLLQFPYYTLFIERILNKCANKQINGFVLLWYNYRFLLFCFPNFFNMFVQLTLGVI